MAGVGTRILFYRQQKSEVVFTYSFPPLFQTHTGWPAACCFTLFCSPSCWWLVRVRGWVWWRGVSSPPPPALQPAWLGPVLGQPQPVSVVIIFLNILRIRVVDPEWFFLDPTPDPYPTSDPDPTFKEVSAPTPDPDPLLDPPNSHCICEITTIYKVF